MKKIFKWIGIFLGSIILLLVLAVLVMVFRFNSKLNRQYDFAVETISVPADSASIAAGKSWSGICTSCHGENLGGMLMFDDPSLATIYASNLTGGAGGVGSTYTDLDWVRAIRHGVGSDGKALFLMPAYEFNHLSEQDLANLIAYLKSLEPVDQMSKPLVTTTFAKVLGEMGAFGTLFPAEAIDHDAGFAAPLSPSINPEYGEYVVNVAGCRTCHGPDLNGGKDPNPEAPPAPNLTPAGIMAKYSEDQFVTTLRTGKSLAGRDMNPEFMPWKGLGKMDDLKIKAIYAYLKTLPPLETQVK